jgi:YgiT-type zinc finger domain-containing protein
MLSSVLNSDRALQVTIEIMRGFVRLRELIATGSRNHRPLAAAVVAGADVSWRDGRSPGFLTFSATSRMMTPDCLRAGGIIAMKPDSCEYCNAPLGVAEKLVTVYRHRNSQHFIFEHVPARVCSRCGERYFSARVAREMDRLMHRRKQRSPTVPVPVIPLKIAV